MMTYHSSFIKRGYISLQLKFEDANVFVNGDYIVAVKAKVKDGSIVEMTSGQVYYVKETPEKILELLRKLYG